MVLEAINKKATRERGASCEVITTFIKKNYGVKNPCVKTIKKWLTIGTREGVFLKIIGKKKPFFFPIPDEPCINFKQLKKTFRKYPKVIQKLKEEERKMQQSGVVVGSLLESLSLPVELFHLFFGLADGVEVEAAAPHSDIVRQQGNSPLCWAHALAEALIPKIDIPPNLHHHIIGVILIVMGMREKNKWKGVTASELKRVLNDVAPLFGLKVTEISWGWWEVMTLKFRSAADEKAVEALKKAVVLGTIWLQKSRMDEFSEKFREGKKIVNFERKNEGKVKGHALLIIDVAEENGVKMFKFKNWWGNPSYGWLNATHFSPPYYVLEEEANT